MVTREEKDRIIAWCEKTKSERERAYIIERNPFRNDIPWMRRFIFIEIDRPKEIASKNSLVYDSTTKTLWEFTNMNWRRIEPDFRVER